MDGVGGYPKELDEIKGRYILGPQRLYVFSEAVICGSDAVSLTRRGKIILENSMGWRKRAIYEFINALGDGILREGVGSEKATESAVVMTGQWVDNYHHWLIDYLPRLALLRDADNLEGDELNIVLRENPEEWMLKSINMLGYNEEDIIYWSEGSLKVDKLIVPSHTRYTHEGQKKYNKKWPVYSSEGLKRVSKMLKDTINHEISKGKFVYISRADADSRRVINEEELIKEVHNYGFESYKLSNISFKDQVKLFSSSEVIISPHGAGLSNMIFSDDPIVIELAGPQFVPCYFAISKALNYRYYCLKSKTVNNNMFVNVKSLSKLLDSVMAEK
jgi:hypothetical protein